MAFDLDETNAVAYLSSRGLVDPGTVKKVELLGWGVSNVLVKVQTRGDCMVIKQSLARLRVTEDWFADRERIYRECACIDTLSTILPIGAIPEVRYQDQENFLFVMSCAPGTGVNWKEQLLAGQVDRAVAAKVGAALGAIHRETTSKPAVRERFLNHQPFIQLRIEPYHWTTAKLHPELAPVIRQEAARMLEVKTALVHGDFSPKNIIVTGRDVFLLDFEVVHYGNPVFDLAFMLNHLMLKSVHNAGIREMYFHAARSFWQGYREKDGLDAQTAAQRERDTIKQTGCLMLARIDGKSPAEYIVDPAVKESVRSIARDILLGEYAKLDDMMALVDDKLGQSAVSGEAPVQG